MLLAFQCVTWLIQMFQKKNLASSIQDNTCTFAEGGKSVGETVLDTFTHCNALQRTTTHCNALQQHMWLEQHMSVLDTFTRCNALQRTATTRVIRMTHVCIRYIFAIVWSVKMQLSSDLMVQLIAFGESFLQSQVSTNHLVLFVSFATFRWKETN